MAFSLETILSMLSEEGWRTIATHAKVSYKPGKPVAFQKMKSRLTNPVYIAEALHALSPEEHEILTHWMLRTREDLTFPPITTESVALAMTGKLGHRGLMYQIQTPYGWVYTVPTELASPLLYAVLQHNQAITPMIAQRRTPRSVDTAPLWWSLVHNVFMILSHAKREPLPLAQQGYVYKRVTNKLVTKSWEHRNDADVLEAAIYFARRLGLLVYPDQNYRTLQTDSNVQSFWQNSPEYILQIAKDMLVTHSSPMVQNLLWTVLGHLEADQWIDLDGLNRWALKERIIGYNTYVRDYVVNEAVSLGLVELDQGLCRYTDVAYWGQRGRFESVEAESIVVQPTGEVLVPPSAPYADRWAVDNLATPVKWDRMGVYQIDRKSVETIIDQGIPLETYLDSWRGLSRTGIPANVQTNIRDWYRTLTRHRLLKATIIHSQDAAESSKIEQILTKAKEFRMRLSPHDLIISEPNLASVQKALERAGIPIPARVDTPGGVAADADDDAMFDEIDEFYDDRTDRNPGQAVIQALLPGIPLVPILDPYTIQTVVREAMTNRSPLTVYYVENASDKTVTRVDLDSAYIKDRHLLGIDINQQAFSMPLDRVRSAMRRDLP